MRKNKKWQPMPQKVRHVQELMDLFAALTEDKKFFEILKIMGGNSMRPISGLDVIEQEGIKKGFSQGFEKGKRDGIAENTFFVITNMLKENFSYNIIAKIAGTSVENVSRIAEENNLGYK